VIWKRKMNFCRLQRRHYLHTPCTPHKDEISDRKMRWMNIILTVEKNASRRTPILLTHEYCYNILLNTHCRYIYLPENSPLLPTLEIPQAPPHP
jgi:hypothetical protein